jgi:hypothetical protein
MGTKDQVSADLRHAQRDAATDLRRVGRPLDLGRLRRREHPMIAGPRRGARTPSGAGRADVGLARAFCTPRTLCIARAASTMRARMDLG